MCVHPSCIGSGFDSGVTFFKHAGGRGDLQSSAQRSSLQASQEARIDHPCVPAPNQFELLISVPAHSCTAFPFTQFRILLMWHFCDLNSDFEEHPLWNQLQVSKPVQCVLLHFVWLLISYVCCKTTGAIHQFKKVRNHHRDDRDMH